MCKVIFKPLILAIVFLFVVEAGWTQKGEFKTLFLEAETYFQQDNFVKAIPIYQKIIEKGLGNAHIYYNLGLSFLDNPFEIPNAIDNLEKASLDISNTYKEGSYKELKAPQEALFYLGKAYRLNRQFDKAEVQYIKFKELLSEKDASLFDFVGIQINACRNAESMINNPVKIVKKLLPEPINTVDDEICPTVTPDGTIMIYSTTKNIYDRNYEEDVPFSFLYECTRLKGDSIWSKPLDITNKIGSDGNFVPSYLSADCKELILLWNEFGDAFLYHTTFDGKKWSDVITYEKPINTGNDEIHACYSITRDTIIFVSGRKSSLGGKDIFMSKKMSDGTWSEPENLGPVINTPYDEDTPYLMPDGKTLYFSSEAHNTMGGFDVFQSTLMPNGEWSVPLNLGYPVNSLFDDLFYVPFNKGRSALISLNLQGGIGKKDIYQIDFILPEPVISALPPDTIKPVEIQPEPSPQPVASQEVVQNQPVNNQEQVIPETRPAEPPAPVKPPEPKLIKVAGSVRLNDNNSTDNRFKVEVFKKNSKVPLVVLTPSSADGSFATDLPDGDYKIKASGEGYQAEIQNLFLPADFSGNQVEANFQLEPTPVFSGDYLSIKSLFFDFNSALLKRDSKIEIEKLYQTMSHDTSLYVEVVGHADAKGTENSNQKISELRARQVVNFLVDKGIDPIRFVTSGAGTSENIAINQNPDGSDNPEGRQFNRRADIRVLRTGKSRVVVEQVPVPNQLRMKTKGFFTILLTETKKELGFDYFAPYKKDSIDNVWLFPVATGYLYTVGAYKTKDAAVSMLNRAVEAGFADAQIVDKHELDFIKQQREFSARSNRQLAKQKDPNTVYTIQLMALRNAVELSYFSKVPGVQMYKGEDGITRYYVGEYKGYPNAVKARNEMVAQGYPGAFIMNIERYK